MKSDDDEEEDDENAEDQENEEEDDNSDFNSKHPRQPAGAPGGIGGQFAPKDESVSASVTSQSNAWLDDRIDSDPVGGLVVPAVAAAGAIEAGVVNGALAVGSRIASAISDGNAISDISTTDAIANNPAIDWKLGSFKSDTTWSNQMASRGWTPAQIDEMLQNGEQFAAQNKVNPDNAATRYMDSATGRYVVRDDITGEILQISRDGFEPNK